MRLGRGQPVRRTPDLTPMVDVIFLLIVFFLAAARLEQDRREPVDLPQQSGEPDRSRGEGLVLTLMGDGALRIAGVSRDIDALPALLAEASREQMPSVTLRANREVDVAVVDRVIRILARSGVPGVEIAVAPGGGS
ncbi:MAG: hypothetical protein CMJ28_00855 [Phycisphaerae bacterium]|nr:hypothetical protein [Phycisphaerae bacterium]